MNVERSLKFLAIAAMVFGALTILSGGRALFGNLEARAEFGNVVPFVLWFNFMAGFVYILAGAGLLRAKRWAATVSMFLAVSTVFVFLAFSAHVIAGGVFEMRTVGALSVRSLFWIGVALLARRAMKTSSSKSRAP